MVTECLLVGVSCISFPGVVSAAHVASGSSAAAGPEQQGSLFSSPSSDCTRASQQSLCHTSVVRCDH